MIITRINLQNMISKTLRIFKLIAIFLLVALVASAQKGNGNFHISGKIRVENGDPTGAIVTLSNLTTKTIENSVTLTNTGKFEFDLKFFMEFKMSVVKEGHYTKDIDVSTMIPSQIWEKDSIFPPYPIVVTIYKKVPDVTLSFEGKTVGKIRYSPKGKYDNLDADIYIEDKEIRREIDRAVQEKEDEIFNRKMAEAVEFEKKNQIREAVKAYEEALALRKNDKFIKPKLRELASDLKNLEKDALLDSQLQKLIAAGDDNVAKLKYPEAIDNFKAALSLKPGDQRASDKLTAAEKMLSAANAEKAKLDAEFNRLLAEGDAGVSAQKYPEAIAIFKQALVLKPENQLATSKLTNATQLLARLDAEKQKLEADYARLLASGDNNVTSQKYQAAIEDFKGALTIRTGDPTATARLSNAERLLAGLKADMAKMDAEFNRLLAAGDAGVSAARYAEAIENFKSALVIKSGDKLATSKLTNAVQLLAKMDAEKAKLEAEFNRLLSLGDAEVFGQKYPEAIDHYKSALKIKTGDSVAMAKLADAENLLAKLNADKAGREAEFNRLLAEGDANVSVVRYPEAIDNFKAALNIKIGDKVAGDKLANVMQLVAKQNAEKARQEAEFESLLAAGDNLLTGQKYVEAIDKYKAALVIKANNPTALSKIANAESLLAGIKADKAKLEAEFNRLLAAGDANVSGVRYPEAIDNFKAALTIKTGDQVAAAKLDNVLQLIAKQNAEKARQDAEFERLLSAGDLLVTGQKYSEAIDKFKAALLIKANNPAALLKITNAENLLSRLNADKAKLEAEFNRLLAAGDANVSGVRYPEAIDNFKAALTIKTGDQVAAAKLANVLQLVAKENAEKARIEAEFKRLLAAGDIQVTAQKYPDAIENFKLALKIKAGDQVAAAKLANAEQLLSQLKAEKERLEAEFIRLMADGGLQVTAQKYSEGILDYKGALVIKAGDPGATSKLAEAEKLLAALNAEKLKKEEAQRLLAQQQAAELAKLRDEGSYLKNIQTGDLNFSKSLWSVAVFYYQEALKYKKEDKYALERVDNCKKMIDSNITAEKMQEYTASVKRADQDLQSKKYSSASFYFGKASEILPWENYPKEQLKLIEKLLSSTDVNGIDAQYADAIKKADEAVVQKNYAIARFYFQKANSLKPDEEYPKQQLKRLSTN